MPAAKAKQDSQDVKVTNRRLLIQRRQHLDSDDEHKYIRAADSLTQFLARREAYYTEARPLIVNALKEVLQAARDTLTRLAHSDLPFVTYTAYPESLKARVLAFSSLVRTVQKFEDRFDKDSILKAEVKSIIASVSTKPVAEENGAPATDLLPSTVQPSKALLSKSQSDIHSEMNPSTIQLDPQLSTSEAKEVSPIAEIMHDAGLAPSEEHNQSCGNVLKTVPLADSKMNGGSAEPIDTYSVNLTNVSQAVKPSASTISRAGPSTRPKKKAKVNFSRAINRADALQIDQTDFENKHHDVTSSGTGFKIGGTVASPAILPSNPAAASLVSTNIAAPSSGPSTNVRQSLISSDTKDLDVVMVDLPTNGTQLKGQPVFLAMQPGEEMGSDVVLSFSVSQDEMARLHEWRDRNKRQNNVEEVESSLCLSLMSFTIDDAVDSGLDLSEASNVPDSAPLMKLRSTWPSNFRLHATVGEKDLFLAPPLMPTPENHVDVATFALPSSQDRSTMSITIHCLCNRTDYVFAILLHPPSKRQLQEWHIERERMQKWRERLRAASTITYESVFGPRVKKAEEGAFTNGSTTTNIGVECNGANSVGVGLGSH